MGETRARGRGLGARPGRARHLVLVRRCGRSRRSAGRARPRSCAPSTRPTCSRTARDIIFLWVARMVMFGHRVHRRAPVHRREHPLGHPGARRAAHVEVARHRHRPARADRRRPRPPCSSGRRVPRLRRRRPALRAARDVLVAGRALQRGARQAGARPGEQALERLAADPAARGRRRARPGRGRDGRGPLDRLAARAPHRSASTELLDGFRFSRAALELYDAFWSELCDWYLELAKPRLYEEDNAAVSAVLLCALERTLRLLHPVMPFVTEEIWSLHARRARPAGRGRLARGRTRRASTTTPRPRSGA